MVKERVENCINQYEFMEQEVLTEEKKRIFRIAYNMGLKDGKEQGKQELLDFLDS